MATFDQTVQPPPPSWDPFATPGSTPTPLLPEDPSFQLNAPVISGAMVAPGFSVATMQRFLDEMRLDYVWMAGSGPKELGINDLQLSARFAIPILHNIQTPLLITPGFAIHYFNGPKDPMEDLPPRTYDAYLEGAWNPQMTTWAGGELALRVGVYSDFDKVTDESVRLTGKGLVVLTFSPSIKFKAGAWYLDRNHVKILPAGGLIWTPNPDVRFEILFPDPKIAMRLANFGSVQWWAYLRGEYGGGAWTARGTGGQVVSFDYNDLRVALGLEFERANHLGGLFEIGMAFDRELYRSSLDNFSLNSTVFIRAGLLY